MPGLWTIYTKILCISVAGTALKFLVILARRDNWSGVYSYIHVHIP
jgi:hypothetical protein